MGKIRILGVVTKPIIKGLEWESKAIFQLPENYCKYLGIEANEILYLTIRINEEKQKTIFVNKSIDSKFGQRTTLSNKNTISINNFILGIKSSEFYEISVVEYNKTRLSIKIQEIAKLPRYLTESEKEKSGVKNGDL